VISALVFDNLVLGAPVEAIVFHVPIMSINRNRALEWGEGVGITHKGVSKG
jgi:hypothetical protein